MATIQEIVDSVAELAARRVSLEDFEDWSAELSWDAHRRESEAVQSLVFEIRAILNRHENDLDDGQSLLAELETATRPFVQSRGIVGQRTEFRGVSSSSDIKIGRIDEDGAAMSWGENILSALYVPQQPVADAEVRIPSKGSASANELVQLAAVAA